MGMVLTKGCCGAACRPFLPARARLLLYLVRNDDSGSSRVGVSGASAVGCVSFLCSFRFRSPRSCSVSFRFSLRSSLFLYCFPLASCFRSLRVFRTPESATLPSIFITFLCFITFCDPLIFIAFQGGGGSCRRQGKSAAPGAGVVGSLGEIGSLGLGSLEHIVNETEGARG